MKLFQSKKKVWITAIALVYNLVFLLSHAIAGPNTFVGCGIDMNYATRNYEPIVSDKDIDSTLPARPGDEFIAAIVIQNVLDLDTFQVEIDFDVEQMAFIEGYEDAPDSDVQSFLKINGGKTIGFAAVERVPGKINVANSLVGTDKDQAPEGSGIIAFLKFRRIDDSSDNALIISKLNTLNSNRINDAASRENFVHATVSSPVSVPGDLDGDGDVDRNDVGMVKFYLGKDKGLCPECDIDNDGRITVLDARKLMGMCTCQRCLCP